MFFFSFFLIPSEVYYILWRLSNCIINSITFKWYGTNLFIKGWFIAHHVLNGAWNTLCVGSILWWVYQHFSLYVIHISISQFSLSPSLSTLSNKPSSSSFLFLSHSCRRYHRSPSVIIAAISTTPRLPAVYETRYHRCFLLHCTCRAPPSSWYPESATIKPGKKNKKKTLQQSTNCNLKVTNSWD